MCVLVIFSYATRMSREHISPNVKALKMTVRILCRSQRAIFRELHTLNRSVDSICLGLLYGFCHIILFRMRTNKTNNARAATTKNEQRKNPLNYPVCNNAKYVWHVFIIYTPAASLGRCALLKRIAIVNMLAIPEWNNGNMESLFDKL